MKKILFDTAQKSIQSLMDDVDSGRLALPEIQRPFVWNSTKVRDLFNSLYRGYPIGYLLFWANVGDQDIKHIGTDDKESRVQSLIIDGQQRLTALFAVIRGHPIIDERYQTKKLKIAFNPMASERGLEVANAITDKDDKYISDISLLFQLSFDAHAYIENYLKTQELSMNLTREQRSQIPKNINALRSILDYELPVLEISENVDEEEVAEIFVRINSQGKVLNQADFVLTHLSVDWDEGRKKIEDFARQSVDPNYKPRQGHSAYNQLTDVQPAEILRSIVGYGFKRGRMSDVYSLLRGRDFETREYKPGLRQERMKMLKGYVRKGLDNTTWHSYIGLIQSMGFRHPSLIKSRTSLFYSYAFYLIGKNQYKLTFQRLEQVIARWFLMSVLTSRYSGSNEAQFESDLSSLRFIKKGDDFVETLNKHIDIQITNDFWEIRTPDRLRTSFSANPLWLTFIAAQIKNNVRLLFSDRKLADVFDPAVQTKKSQIDRHHVFPKNHLHKLGIEDRSQQNQVANYVYLDFRTNIAISDKAPKEYFLKYKRYDSDIDKSLANHALPVDFFKMKYQDYLEQRRRLMALYLKKYFEGISKRR